jgi:light-regulated signal transduction histidine kinase (bacteriophytochrome)
VTDTASGIPEEHQARIFEQLHQVDSSLTKAAGTGLGLAIAKQIVEMDAVAFGLNRRSGRGLPNGTPHACRTPEAYIMMTRTFVSAHQVGEIKIRT